MARCGHLSFRQASPHAQEQAIPGQALEAVATELRRAGLVLSRRGPDGRFSLAKLGDKRSLTDGGAL